MKRALWLAVLAMGVATWVHATYVVILRSGDRIVAREKYTVKASNAVVILKNGTLTSIPLAGIDVEATEKANALHLGDATSLDWVDAGRIVPTPTPTPSVTTLGKLREDVAKPVADAARPTPTPGITFHDAAYRDPQVDRAFQDGLERYHVYLYRTSRGTNPDYLFIEVQVNGQPEVVKTLQAVTMTYHVLAQTAASRAPAAVELQLLNEAGKEAGVFRITAADAEELAGGKVTPEEFFVKHVIF